MDPRFNGYSESIHGFKLSDETILPNSDQHPNGTNGFKFEHDLANGFKFEHDFPDINFLDLPFTPSDLDPGNSAPSLSPSSTVSPEGGSPSDDGEDPVLKYISQILMEEDMEEKPCMLRDSLALHAAEKSLYEVIGEKYPPSANQHPLYLNLESPDDNFSGSFSDYSSNSSSSTVTGNSVDPQYIGDLGEFKPSLQQSSIPLNNYSSLSMDSGSNSSVASLNSFSNNINGLVENSVSALLAQNIFSDSESVLQFKRGVEEASKFLPSNSNLLIDLEKYTPFSARKEVASEVVVKAEKVEMEHSPNGSRGRKREDIDLEDGRSNKQSAVYVEETELSEMFDSVLLCTEKTGEHCGGLFNEVLLNGESKSLQQNEESQGANGGKSRGKKQGNRKEVVDLRTLLILCAQAVSADDRRTATELLKQIRQHSSPSGDGSQRLAHCFANGLEARLAGTGTQMYTALAPKRTSAADILKAYKVFLQACPFKKIAILFANHMIFKAADKAKTLHVIDFGISYGFQWPILIQCLSTRPGGPPKLRITGIELPQPGFRPAERVEETGRRLAKYCERFNVPFEYIAIAQKWETIQIEDLKIDSNEVVAVNCLYRFKNLLDETVVVNSPRNTVLNLIRKMNPAIFVHAVVNGSYNAPFFVTRFREALFHFSALFDFFDATVARENSERLMFEQEFYARDAVNVIACEGSERVERPETYKQWQVRNTRAGFRQIPLDEELMKKLKAKLKRWYHKDFVINEDGRWLLLGWKGRIVYGTSCWVPA